LLKQGDTTGSGGFGGGRGANPPAVVVPMDPDVTIPTPAESP